LAHAAAAHGDTLAEAVNAMLQDPCQDDSFMNEQQYPSETAREEFEEVSQKLKSAKLAGQGPEGFFPDANSRN
jgi:hypothetical protein